MLLCLCNAFVGTAIAIVAGRLCGLSNTESRHEGNLA